MPHRWSDILSILAHLHHDLSVLRKLAKKRKETMSSTRQEMTVMVNSMDKSYAEQGTNCDEAFSFMDTHNLNGRCECAPGSTEHWVLLGTTLPGEFLGPSAVFSPSKAPGNTSLSLAA